MSDVDALKRKIVYSMVFGLMVLGASASGAVYGIIQDLMGKDAWIRHIEAHWGDPRVSYPLEFLSLVVIIFSVRAFTRALIRSVTQ